MKKPKKRYGIEDTNFNQFDFPKNHPILTFTQFKLAKNFKDKDEYTRLKIHFQAVLGKSKEEAWSLVNIFRVMWIVSNVFFKLFLHNFCYLVLWENNVAFELTIANFPLMNQNDLNTVSNFLCNVDASKVAEENRNVFVLGYAHIKAFVDCYYEYFSITDIHLSMAINKSSKVPQSLLRGKLNIVEFKDGEIIHKTFGVVF